VIPHSTPVGGSRPHERGGEPIGYDWDALIVDVVSTMWSEPERSSIARRRVLVLDGEYP
jgi:hypothetical protein